MSRRWDWSYVHKRASTWLSVLTTMQGGAAAAFVAAPDEWRSAMPDWLGMALLGGSMVTGALVPLATSYRQRPFGPKPPGKEGDPHGTH